MNSARCNVVLPGEGSKHWALTDLVSTYVTAEQSGGAYSVIETVAQPGGGPPPHRHNREDEIFYILEGSFEMLLGEQTFAASAGESIFLPRGVVHTFRNIGAAPGRILVVTVPGGFDAFVADAGVPCADPAAVPQVTQAAIEKLQAACARHGLEIDPHWQPKRSAPAAAKPRELWVLGLHIRLLLLKEQTNGSFSVAQITAHPGNFVPPHRHKLEDEIFYVVEGTAEFELEGRTITAEAGTLIHIPRGCVHGFRNTTQRPVRLANFHTPGGFDRFFAECGIECRDLDQGPPDIEPDMEQFAAICRKHGMELAVPATV